MNPHSLQAERAKMKGNRADWYSAYFNAGDEALRKEHDVQRLKDAGMTHEEILAALEPRVSDRKRVAW